MLQTQMNQGGFCTPKAKQAFSVRKFDWLKLIMALFQYCVMHGGAYFDSSFVFSVHAKRIKQKKPRMFKACLLIVRGGGGSGRPLPKFVLLWVVAARGVAGAWLRGRGGSPLRRVEVVVCAAGASDLGVARSVAGVVGIGCSAAGVCGRWVLAPDLPAVIRP